MKEVRILYSDSRVYIVPTEEVQEFNRLKEITDDENFSDTWYQACVSFSLKFDKYNVEGNMSKVKFYISDEEFNERFIKTGLVTRSFS